MNFSIKLIIVQYRHLLEKENNLNVNTDLIVWNLFIYFCEPMYTYSVNQIYNKLKVILAINITLNFLIRKWEL